MRGIAVAHAIPWQHSDYILGMSMQEGVLCNAFCRWLSPYPERSLHHIYRIELVYNTTFSIIAEKVDNEHNKKCLEIF